MLDINIMTKLQQLIDKHGALLEQNPHCYFELSYTRQTMWMAWLCSKPREDDPHRKVLALGQGDTPEQAASAALAGGGHALRRRGGPAIVRRAGADARGGGADTEQKLPLELRDIMDQVAAKELSPQQACDMLEPMLTELWQDRKKSERIERFLADRKKELSTIGYSNFTEEDAELLR